MRSAEMETDYLDRLSCLVDLHLHLDGAISPPSARKLAQMQNMEIPASDEELERRIRVSPGCRSLNEFLEKFAFPCSLLQTPESLTAAVVNLLDEQAEQGVMYAEIRFAPQLHTEKGMTQEDAVRAALSGIRQGAIHSNLILCCMRGAEPAKNRETVAAAGCFLGQGVAALDLAGAEALYPTADYAAIFAEADEMGIPFTIHAGEAAGPASVEAALEMGARRIGHGVLAGKNQRRDMAEYRIPVEMCPTSNLCTCVVGELSEWPLPEFIADGVPVTINTDDPAIVGTTLREEYRKLIETFGLNKAAIRSLLHNAADASFACDELKNEMHRRIDAELRGGLFGWLMG